MTAGQELEALIKTALSEIERLASARTVVGQEVVAEGRTIIPLLYMGFAFGGASGSGKGDARQGEGSGFGVGGGAGAKVVAVIIIDKDGVRVEPIKSGLASVFEKMADTVPQMMEKCMEKCGERWGRKKEE